MEQCYGNHSFYWEKPQYGALNALDIVDTSSLHHHASSFQHHGILFGYIYAVRMFSVLGNGTDYGLTLQEAIIFGHPTSMNDGNKSEYTEFITGWKLDGSADYVLIPFKPPTNSVITSNEHETTADLSIATFIVAAACLALTLTSILCICRLHQIIRQSRTIIYRRDRSSLLAIEPRENSQTELNHTPDDPLTCETDSDGGWGQEEQEAEEEAEEEGPSGVHTVNSSSLSLSIWSLVSDTTDTN